MRTGLWKETPNLEIEIQQAADEAELFAYPEFPEDAAAAPPEGWAEVTMVSPAGDIVVRGRRITYIRNYPDGTQDIMYADG